MARSPFATFLIICPTSFFLGILFNNWTFDHKTLWAGGVPTEDIVLAVESHYSQLAQSPTIIGRVLHTMVAVGLFAFISKLYKPSESNLLFDGASLVLYVVALAMYLTNVLQGLAIVDTKTYSEQVGRIDSLKVIAATHTILALVLTGVLVLQAGQWYAEGKETEEIKNIEKEDREILAKIEKEKKKE